MSDAPRYVSKEGIPPNLYLEGVTIKPGRVINGGYSDVYRGTLAGYQVAIKRMRYADDDEENNKRWDAALEKEITMLMKLNEHPNIVRFLGLTKLELDETPCIVTLWARKGTLASCQKKETFVLDRKRIIIEVASALVFLHSGKGMKNGADVVVHGDLHPNNIFIGEDDRARLADFGICKLIPPGQQPSISLRLGGPAGRMAYIAPELHGTGLRGVKTDVFSFGMLVYEVMGGNLSALGGTQIDIAGSIKEGRRPERFGGLADNVWGTIKSCWQVDPGMRPTMESALGRLTEEWPLAAAAVAAHAAKWFQDAAEA